MSLGFDIKVETEAAHCVAVLVEEICNRQPSLELGRGYLLAGRLRVVERVGSRVAIGKSCRSPGQGFRAFRMDGEELVRQGVVRPDFKRPQPGVWRTRKGRTTPP